MHYIYRVTHKGCNLNDRLQRFYTIIVLTKYVHCDISLAVITFLVLLINFDKRHTVKLDPMDYGKYVEQSRVFIYRGMARTTNYDGKNYNDLGQSINSLILTRQFTISSSKEQRICDMFYPFSSWSQLLNHCPTQSKPFASWFSSPVHQNPRQLVQLPSPPKPSPAGSAPQSTKTIEYGGT